jgi:hypothetical protein
MVNGDAVTSVVLTDDVGAEKDEISIVRADRFALH